MTPRRPAVFVIAAVQAALALAGCGSAPTPTAAAPAGGGYVAPGGTATPAPAALAPALARPFEAAAPAPTAVALPAAVGLDLFRAETWAPGALAGLLATALAEPEADYASGAWKDTYTAAQRATYLATLGVVPVGDYDPKRFLRELGLVGNPRGPGRDDAAMLRAWRQTDFKPDPRYFPGPEGLKASLQSAVLKGAKLSPGMIQGLDKAVTATVIRMMEKPDRLDPHPYGEEGDIEKGPKAAMPPAERYAGVVLAKSGPRAWDHGIHRGSIAPEPDAAFGTYDVARHLGFTDAQARRIADSDFDVDLDATHYREGGQPRKTASGTGGDNGDLHWHYNRAKKGEEDTRIAGARVHLKRAVVFAKAGYYEAAERELGVGLHGMQDMFSHGQITPFNHALVGEFPDVASFHPQAAFETLVMTEGYLAKYVAELKLVAPVRPASTGTDAGGFDRAAAIARLVGGDAGGEARARLDAELAGLPDGLLALLDRHGVRLVLDVAGAPATARGFGRDLDGDGLITPGAGRDLDGDGAVGVHEHEDGLADGRSWTTVPAGYDPARRMIWLGAGDLPTLGARLKHEVAHAVDDLLMRDPALAERWTAYRAHAHRLARRAGAIAFDGADAAELIADSLGAAAP